MRSRRADRHATKLARLFAREKRLAADTARLRAVFDRALLDARRARVMHKEIAHAIIEVTGLPPTEDEVVRLEAVLQTRAKRATRRTGGPDRVLDGQIDRVQDDLAKEAEDMKPNEPILTRKTVTTETFEYAHPQADLDPLDEDLGDDDHGVDGEDDAEDEDEIDGAAPDNAQHDVRPTRRR